jgi:4-hydroxy-tetrahydrodipicolinate reductase
MTLKILLNGAKGRMGQTIARLAPDYDAVVFAGVDQGDDPSQFVKEADVLIDFSFHAVTLSFAQLAVANGKPIVIGTTGHTPQEKADIIACAKSVPMIFAGNYSLGVNLLYFLVERAAKALGPEYNPEVVEMHHNLKKDAPSGTAERIVEVLREARGISKDHVRNGREGMVGASAGRDRRARGARRRHCRRTHGLLHRTGRTHRDHPPRHRPRHLRARCDPRSPVAQGSPARPLRDEGRIEPRGLTIRNDFNKKAPRFGEPFLCGQERPQNRQN